VKVLEQPSYAKELDEEMDSDYGYIQRVLQKFQEYGLVSSEKDGQKRMYELTDTGRDAAELLDELSSVLGGGENP
jgi:DNA-binding PadR family transcriptional regulator